ncbi:DUF3630 family protein [Thalassotalea sp. Y01]|uniref:DUF3630 family protein n=1 Tax=Thalassotalea sp. Y01 TaxID=2729613 RepID=UPI00145EB5E0|nr:DUF3630 family protein [Thalassotalea sp. Y01]NMP16968.1 DUF3630 family protein [Thalassotalea sp. Y01]
MKLTKINSHTVSLDLANQWDQEQALSLSQEILAKLGQHQVIETIAGADRFDCRFRFAEQDFVLHFEHYSESCWIEADDEFNELGIAPLLPVLIEH